MKLYFLALHDYDLLVWAESPEKALIEAEAYYGREFSPQERIDLNVFEIDTKVPDRARAIAWHTDAKCVIR